MREMMTVMLDVQRMLRTILEWRGWYYLKSITSFFIGHSI
jgi:hypothetical protein